MFSDEVLDIMVNFFNVWFRLRQLILDVVRTYRNDHVRHAMIEGRVGWRQIFKLRAKLTGSRERSTQRSPLLSEFNFASGVRIPKKQDSSFLKELCAMSLCILPQSSKVVQNIITLSLLDSSSSISCRKLRSEASRLNCLPFSIMVKCVFSFSGLF